MREEYRHRRGLQGRQQEKHPTEGIVLAEDLEGRPRNPGHAGALAERRPPAAGFGVCTYKPRVESGFGVCTYKPRVKQRPRSQPGSSRRRSGGSDLPPPPGPKSLAHCNWHLEFISLVSVLTQGHACD